MFTAIYFALVIMYCVYTVCECSWAKTDKKVMASLLLITSMMLIWDMFA